MTEKENKNRNIKFVSPVFIFIIMFIYFIVIPFISMDRITDYIYSFLIAIIGFFSFIFGYILKPSESSLIRKYPQRTIIKKILLYIFLINDAFTFIQLLLFGISQDAYNLSYLNSQGANSLYLMILTNILTFVKMYIYFQYSSYGKKQYWFIFILSILVAFTSRQRFDIVSIVCMFGIFGIFYNYIKIKLGLIIPLAIVLFPVFSTVALVARDFVGTATLSEYFQYIKFALKSQLNSGQLSELVKTSMESFATYEIFNQVIKNNLILPLNGIFRIFFLAIPRSFWPEKPLPMQNMLAYHFVPEAYRKGGGVFANIFGDAYLNGGILMVIIILFILGILFRKLFNNLTNWDKKSPISIGVYSYSIVFLLSFYRGQLSDILWQFILMLFVFKICNSFERDY